MHPTANGRDTGRVLKRNARNLQEVSCTQVAIRGRRVNHIYIPRDRTSSHNKQDRHHFGVGTLLELRELTIKAFHARCHHKSNRP